MAITPRSFCNGPYFRPFREWLLSEMALIQMHVFDSRTASFRDDDVLQENVIFHACKGVAQPPKVLVSCGMDADEGTATSREVEYRELVRPGDPNLFIHVVPDELNRRIADRMACFTTRLEELDLTESTGRVVDFRSAAFLRQQATEDTVRLIYPAHLNAGTVVWPKPNGRKPNALALNPSLDDQTLPPGAYVLVKRFSAKEERRRVVAAVYNSARVSPKRVAFENHLNFYHCHGAGLPLNLARGLAVFLNSTLVDTCFRQFNGHTQVNATDLRSLGYPSREQIMRLGELVEARFPEQHELDELVEEVVQSMEGAGESLDPIRANS